MIRALRLVIEKHWEYNQPLFIAFVDLEKAFDRVPREKLCILYLHRHVQTTLLRRKLLLKNYKNV